MNGWDWPLAGLDRPEAGPTLHNFWCRPLGTDASRQCGYERLGGLPPVGVSLPPGHHHNGVGQAVFDVVKGWVTVACDDQETNILQYREHGWRARRSQVFPLFRHVEALLTES